MPHLRTLDRNRLPLRTGGRALAEDLWRGELNRAAELRLWSAKLGLPHGDRLKSGIRYVTRQIGAARSPWRSGWNLVCQTQVYVDTAD